MAQLVGALFVAVDVSIAESEVVLAGGGGAETVVSGLGVVGALANALGSSRSTVAAGVDDGFVGQVETSGSQDGFNTSFHGVGHHIGARELCQGGTDDEEGDHACNVHESEGGCDRGPLESLSCGGSWLL